MLLRSIHKENSFLISLEDVLFCPFRSSIVDQPVSSLDSKSFFHPYGHIKETVHLFFLGPNFFSVSFFFIEIS